MRLPCDTGRVGEEGEGDVVAEVPEHVARVHRSGVTREDIVEVHRQLHLLVVEEGTRLAEKSLLRQGAQLGRAGRVRPPRRSAQHSSRLHVEEGMQRAALEAYHAALLALAGVGWSARNVAIGRWQPIAGKPHS
eukprot:209737-Prymnesium_polylepis.1